MAEVLKQTGHGSPLLAAANRPGVKCAAIVAWPNAIHEGRISNVSRYRSTPGPPALSCSTWVSVSSAASS